MSYSTFSDNLGAQARAAVVELGLGARAAAYWTLAVTTVLCYVRARALGDAGDLDRSSEWHSGIHLLGNVANCFLYAGAPAWRRLVYCVPYWAVVGVVFREVLLRE